jgi:cobalt-zinc-cadmium efflux system membrane fusion protein
MGLSIAVSGCGGSAATPTTTPTSTAGHDHGGWWCAEHGIPEEECAQCNARLAAEFQKNGDWCEMHNRPDSQCFVCHPEHEAKFAAKYEAKYGTKPPKREM